MPADANPVRELFLVALELSALERAGYLNRHCPDPGMRAEVERLLAAHDQLSSIDLPRSDVATAAYVPVTESVGTLIGPYKLLEQIGEGGFGLVFVAEQTEPVRRKVALKIIKPGMDSAQVIRRFQAERQALALMDHHNIAKVLDAGSTVSGRPYFVMELVRGLPITDYCDKNQLPPKERLELFITVCQAIQHAHQKGIIHRDIKPSNVLVTSHDGKPVAKVIDFGIAKAIHQQLTDKTIYTQVAQMIGTPLYMSPEQAEMSGLDIDTRSDIYSLGVLLYELLTGTTPLEKKRFAQAAYEEMRRLIREEEPPKPSARLSSSDAIASIAALRHTEPAKLSKLISGDLDWITMKALEKDRTRRYETANGLARDIERYLSDELVEASPPSAIYRLQKFAKKNRAALSTATTLACLLITGIAVSSWQAVRATHAELEAKAAADAERQAKLESEEQKENALQAAQSEAAEKKKAEAAKQEAQVKEAEANAVVKFFEDKVFSAGRPKAESGGLGHDVSLSEAIQASLPALGTSFVEQPLVEARLRLTLGKTFYYLGEHAKAAEQQEQARLLFTRHLGPDHPSTLQTMHNLATSYDALNRPIDALLLREETLAACKRVLGPDHPNTIKCMINLALSYKDVNRHAEALKLKEETLATCKRVLGPDHRDTLLSMNNLASSFADLNRHAEALKLREEVLTAYKRLLPPNHPEILHSMNALANSYYALNRKAEALDLYEKTLAGRKRVLPPDHSDTLWSMQNLAKSYADMNRQAEALRLREEALAACKRVLPPDHPHTLVSMQDVAQSYVAQNRLNEALPLIDAVLAKAELPGVETQLMPNTIRLRCLCCQKLGDAKGCRAAAEMLEKRNATDATSLYKAASCRALVAELQAKAKAPEAARLTEEDAEKAMAWLIKAVAAGWTDAAQLKTDTDLEFLRDRKDFKKLVGELEKSD
jgi:serine/threonine protein kinase